MFGINAPHVNIIHSFFVSDLYFSNKLTELQISAQLLAKKPDCQIYEPCYLKHEVKTSPTPA